MIKFRLRHIQAVSYLVLVLPVAIFFLGWLKWTIAIPAVVLLIIAYYFSVRRLLISPSEKCDSEEVIVISWKLLLTIIVVILVWCFLAGQGGFFYQSADYDCRNAIFRDLLYIKWPVIYTKTDSALVYYISYWLVPALFGKIVSNLGGSSAIWQIANVFMYLWTCLFIFLVFMLLFFALKARTCSKIMLVMLIFILFSGMDIIGYLCIDGLKVSNIYSSIEWWNAYYQYSANTTQLFWVFNQSTPAWLGVALLLNEKRISNYAFLCALILAFSPLPLIGFLFIAGGLTVSYIIKAVQTNNLSSILRQIFSFQNIVAVLIVVPIFLIYYKSNLAISKHGFRFDIGINVFGMFWAMVIYVLFCALEFGILSLVLLRRYYRNILYWISVFSLCVIAMFRIGSFDDFAMRVSIPALLVLMVLTIRLLFENIWIDHTRKSRFPFLNMMTVALCMILIIGASTPLIEFSSEIHTVIANRKLTMVSDKIKTFSNKPVSEYSNFLSSDYETTPFFKYLARTR